VWLDANLTSPYHFYQFWLNVADADAARYIKIFTFIPLDEIAELERQHTEAPHMRILQKRLAEDITVRVHSREDYNQAVEASEILFGKGTTESLARLPENVFTSVFEGVPQFTVAKADLEAGINVLDLLAVNTTIFPSKGEARKMLVGGGVGINKVKLEDAEAAINSTQLLNNRYLLVQKGKKNYFLIVVN
jgi:tyrosyl-tRNA synthetase